MLANHVLSQRFRSVVRHGGIVDTLWLLVVSSIDFSIPGRESKRPNHETIVWYLNACIGTWLSMPPAVRLGRTRGVLQQRL